MCQDGLETVAEYRFLLLLVTRLHIRSSVVAEAKRRALSVGATLKLRRPRVFRDISTLGEEAVLKRGEIHGEFARTSGRVHDSSVQEAERSHLILWNV